MQLTLRNCKETWRTIKTSSKNCQACHLVNGLNRVSEFSYSYFGHA